MRSFRLSKSCVTCVGLFAWGEPMAATLGWPFITLNSLFGPCLPCHHGLGLAQQVVRLLVLVPSRLLEGFPQTGQCGPGLRRLAEPVVRQRQEGESRRVVLLKAVGLRQRGQGFVILPGAVLRRPQG